MHTKLKSMSFAALFALAPLGLCAEEIIDAYAPPQDPGLALPATLPQQVLPAPDPLKEAVLEFLRKPVSVELIGMHGPKSFEEFRDHTTIGWDIEIFGPGDERKTISIGPDAGDTWMGDLDRGVTAIRVTYHAKNKDGVRKEADANVAVDLWTKNRYELEFKVVLARATVIFAPEPDK